MDDGSSAAIVDLPVSVTVRAMLVHEISRSRRRSLDLRRALGQPALASWLALVDRVSPGLVDVERVRLATILCRHTTARPVPESGD